MLLCSWWIHTMQQHRSCCCCCCGWIFRSSHNRLSTKKKEKNKTLLFFIFLNIVLFFFFFFFFSYELRIKSYCWTSAAPSSYNPRDVPLWYSFFLPRPSIWNEVYTHTQDDTHKLCIYNRHTGERRQRELQGNGWNVVYICICMRTLEINIRVRQIKRKKIKVRDSIVRPARRVSNTTKRKENKIQFFFVFFSWISVYKWELMINICIWKMVFFFFL